MVGRGRGAVLPAWMDSNQESAAPGEKSVDTSNTGTWTEHTAPDGRKYYYNAVLKKSSWSMPKGFDATVSETGAWEEHKAPDGRTYYHNRSTKESKWSLPVGAKVIYRKEAHASGMPVGHLPAFVPPPGALQPGPTPHFATTREAQKAFRKMLHDAQIPSWVTWEHVVPIISVDRRFGAVVAPSDRKLIFAEYIRDRLVEEARSKEFQKKELEERFLETLDSCAVLAESSVPKFEDAMQHLSSDPAWNSISTDKERQDLFERWLDRVAEKKEKEKEEIRENQRQEFLEYLESCTWVSIETVWREAERKLEHVEVFRKLSKVDRIQMFDEFMKKVEERDSSSRSVQEEIRKRKESQHRIVFRKLLREHFESAIIHAKLSWREYITKVGECDEIKDVENNLTGSRPKDLFMDIIAEAEEIYQKDKPVIDACLKVSPIEIGELTPDYGQFKSHIMNCDKYVDIVASSSIKLYLLEEQSRLSVANKGEKKRDAEIHLDEKEPKRIK